MNYSLWLDKYITTERQEFMKKHHKLRISRDATKINTEQTPFDRMMETKGQMFYTNNNS